MKTRLIAIALILSTFTLNAQEQAGIVKTIGRPGQPGVPIEDVIVRVKGSQAVSLSDSDGNFMITLAHYNAGQAYSLSGVHKMGYDLADAGMLGRAFPYSADIPLEISMISEDDYRRTKNEIEAQIRSRMEKEYQEQLQILKHQLEAKSISEETLQQRNFELLDYYDNIMNLAEELSDRYARTDYDRLDSLDQQINILIEQGRLEEAETLIESKQTKKELEEIKASNAALAIALEEGKRAEVRKTAEYADELQKRFEIAAMKFDNSAAAVFLKERMELDLSNIGWRMEYATFICDYLGRYDEAMGVYQELLATEKETSVMADIYGCIGNIYTAQGRFDEALESHMSSAALREGDESLLDDLSTSYSNIAACYISKDNYQSGLEYLEKARVLNEEMKDSLGLAHIYSSLAIVQKAKGEYSECKANLLKAQGIRERHLGEISLPVASIYANLALLMKETGHFPEANEYLDKALSIHKQILGEEHPHVAEDYLLLGSLDIATGNNGNALGYYETALTILKKFHFGVHPTIAEAYNKIGYFHSHVSDDLAKAFEYYQMSYEMLKDIYGEVHSDIAVSLNNLASVLKERAKYEEAIEYYSRAMQVLVALYGEDNPMAGDIYNNMANTYFLDGKKDQSKIYFEKALEISLNYYGEIHPKTAMTYNNLGGVCNSINENDKAIEYYYKACRIYEELYGPDHPDLGNTYNQIGCLFLSQKNYDEAEKYLNEALRIARQAFGPNHSSVLIYLNNLSQLYMEIGDYGKSEEIMLQVKEFYSLKHGEDHPKVATIISNLSVLKANQKEYDKAIEYGLKSLSIYEKNFEADNENVIANVLWLGKLYFNIGEYAQSIPYRTRMYQYYLNKSGMDNNSTRNRFFELYQTYIELMLDPAYDGAYAEEFAEVNEITMITATVTKDSPAEKMGLSGTYQIMAYEEWTLEDTHTNFFIFSQTVNSRPLRTYILHRNGEFIKVPAEGKLGITYNPQLIAPDQKQAIIKTFRKWYRKNR